MKRAIGFASLYAFDAIITIYLFLKKCTSGVKSKYEVTLMKSKALNKYVSYVTRVAHLC